MSLFIILGNQKNYTLSREIQNNYLEEVPETVDHKILSSLTMPVS